MRLALFAWMIACGLPAVTAAIPSHAASPDFPASYRGDWFRSSQSCGQDDIAIRVEETSIQYFDEYWMRKLLRIVRRDARGMTVLAEYTAEGHHWNERVDFRLSPNRRLLTVTRNSVDDKALSETNLYHRFAATKKN